MNNKPNLSITLIGSVLFSLYMMLIKRSKIINSIRFIRIEHEIGTEICIHCKYNTDSICCTYNNKRLCYKLPVSYHDKYSYIPIQE